MKKRSRVVTRIGRLSDSVQHPEPNAITSEEGLGMMWQLTLDTSAITGVSFQEAWIHRQLKQVEGLNVCVLSLDDMILNKSATGRPKDKVDLEWLETLRKQKS